MTKTFWPETFWPRRFGQIDVSAKFTIKVMFLAKDILAKIFFFDFLEKLDSNEKNLSVFG